MTEFDPKTGRPLVTIYLNGEPHTMDCLNANDLVTHCAAAGWTREVKPTVVAAVMTEPQVVQKGGKRKKPETAAAVEGDSSAPEEPVETGLTTEQVDAMTREELDILATSIGISDTSTFSDEELRQAVKLEKGL